MARWAAGLRWPLAAAAVASLLGLALQRAGAFDMPMPPGCGPGLSLAAADLALAAKMAALMTLLGVALPRPTLLTSAQGLRHIGLWLLGLTLFGLADMQAAMAAMGAEAPATQTLLTYGPLAAGLILAAFAPRRAGCCITFMLVMAHFDLMNWPWIGLCALLAAWQQPGPRRHPLPHAIG